jgi:glutamine amidotransferase
MMAHIRCATHGCTSLENNHPFIRELWGNQWVFAHNGEVPAFANQRFGHHVLLGKATANDLSYHAVGDTDSEAVFCAILNALKAEFCDLPTLPDLYDTLRRLCQEILAGHDDDTIFNFLLSCGPYTLFAYSWPGQKSGSTVWNGLYYLLRQPPFSTATLVDVDYTVDFSEISSGCMAVLATKPLTNEKGWIEMNRGELLMFDKGIPYTAACDLEKVEQQGHGLSSRCFLKASASVTNPCTESASPHS